LEYFAASIILNVYLSNYVIDELSFYLYDAGCVIETTFAKRPFQVMDSGQSLMLHEFIHLLVGYKLVKVFQAYGLQPRSVNSMLKTWSPDFFDVFTYLKNESTLSESQQKKCGKNYSGSVSENKAQRTLCTSTIRWQKTTLGKSQLQVKLDCFDMVTSAPAVLPYSGN
jgi:hypothetical protein